MPSNRRTSPLTATLLIVFAGAACAGDASPRSAVASVEATVEPTVAATDSVTPTSSPTRPSPTPGPIVGGGAEWIAYQGWSSTTTHIGVVRPDGSDSMRLAVDGLPSTDLAHPAWSAAGDRIGFDVYTTDADHPTFDRVEPWSALVDGSDPQRIATCALPCLQLAYPAWSPDGTEVALIRYDLLDDETWGPSAVEVVDLATGARRVIAETADGTSAFYVPRWSGDGRSIVVAIETYSDAGQKTFTGLEIGTIPSDGGVDVVSVVTPSHILAREADWDPVGPRLVLTLVDSQVPNMNRASLAVMAADGSDLRVLEAASGPDGGAFHPSWDPDGEWISFVHVEPSGTRRIARIRPDGTGMELLPATSEVRTHPHVRPTP